MNFGSRIRCLATAFVSFVIIVIAGQVSNAAVDGTAHAWPNGRTGSDPPSAAVDGDINTFTWTTAPFTNDDLNYLGVSFSEAADVNRIRLWKDPNCGSGGQPTWDCFKNLTIQYTTDEGPMETRTWTTVQNLASGFGGAELYNASAVNSDGTVELDQHGPEDGWGSLTFDVVNATGVVICFAKTDQPQFYANNHFKVFEFEVYLFETPIPTESSSWGGIKDLYRKSK